MAYGGVFRDGVRVIQDKWREEGVVVSGHGRNREQTDHKGNGVARDKGRRDGCLQSLHV